MQELSEREELLGTAGVARLEAWVGQVQGLLVRGLWRWQTGHLAQAVASGGAVEATVLVQVQAVGLHSAWVRSASLLLGGQEDGRPSGTAS